jgi:hypothetical protein
MNREHMSLEESFHNAFLYFMEALGVLSLEATEQCEAMGNFNVAWELQHDVLDGGTALINWPVDYLSASEKDDIAQLLRPLSELPEAALRSANQEAMSHTAWIGLRSGAVMLIEQLRDAARRNREFFQTQKRT